MNLSAQGALKRASYASPFSSCVLLCCIAGCSSHVSVEQGEETTKSHHRADAGPKRGPSEGSDEDGGALPTNTITDVLGGDDGEDDSTPQAHSSLDGGTQVDACDVAGCGPGQVCDTQDGGVVCVAISCDDLACDKGQECVPDDQGGNVCVDLTCDTDVDCRAEQYCGSQLRCVIDECTPGERTCDGDDLLECPSNGSTEASPYTCKSPAYFESACGQSTGGDAACSCEDDWDCPEFTVCDVNQCRGTGFAPTCTLPPSDFSDTQPKVESHWGGDSRDNDLAHDGSAERNPAPWPDSAHVWSTPIVANLDDDNGDGLIDELDFPEIIFTSYTRSRVDDSGVVRAIHGGGPNRGKDYFARCGELLWQEGDPTPGDCDGGDGRSSAPAAIADLDGDRIPEIVTITTSLGFKILDHAGNLLIDQGQGPAFHDIEGGLPLDHSPDPSIANLDLQGLPEMVLGSTVYTFDLDDQGKLRLAYRLDGLVTSGFNDFTEPQSCVADLSPAPGQELLAGSTLYALPKDLPECADPPCLGTLDVVWSAQEVNTDLDAGNTPAAWDGYCAVADVWGANPALAPGPRNPPDGEPEAILIANGDLMILDGKTGKLVNLRNLGGGPRGGAPNVDDFDGDGYMEIGSALQDFYVVVDLQEPTAADGNCPAWPVVLPRAPAAGGADNPNLQAGAVRDPGGTGSMSLPSGAVVPGACEKDADCADNAVCNKQAKTCVCLHNGWQRDSDDDSSRATSSSVFDFNGDGAAEVLYNDECNFRVYDGATGSVLYSEVSRSRTHTENPVVADVDNDGNAEVVTVMNTEQTGRCDDDPADTTAGPNGVRVWGDPKDNWVSARRIWNQQSYHVTNVTEGGYVPLHAPESWRDYNGRFYNTYRSQPRSYGVAPDLVVGAISVFSADVGCGQLGSEVTIVFEVQNRGDVRVGPGVQVALYGIWDGKEEALRGPDGPLTVVLGTSIEPGHSITQSATFAVADQPGKDALPSRARVVVDSSDDGDFGSERECNEDNNDLSQDVEAGEPRPDLRIELGEAAVTCSTRTATVTVEVYNEGTADAEDVVVQIFAGQPGSGGTLVAETKLDAPLKAGDKTTLEVEVPDFPVNRKITLWGWVDPSRKIQECNEGDNTDPADNPIECHVIGSVR
jgi:hypothetical protein